MELGIFNKKNASRFLPGKEVRLSHLISNRTFSTCTRILEANISIKVILSSTMMINQNPLIYSIFYIFVFFYVKSTYQNPPAIILIFFIVVRFNVG